MTKSSYKGAEMIGPFTFNISRDGELHISNSSGVVQWLVLRELVRGKFLINSNLKQWYNDNNTCGVF